MWISPLSELPLFCDLECVRKVGGLLQLRVQDDDRLQATHMTFVEFSDCIIYIVKTCSFSLIFSKSPKPYGLPTLDNGPLLFRLQACFQHQIECHLVGLVALQMTGALGNSGTPLYLLLWPPFLGEHWIFLSRRAHTCILQNRDCTITR